MGTDNKPKHERTEPARQPPVPAGAKGAPAGVLSPATWSCAWIHHTVYACRGGVGRAGSKRLRDNDGAQKGFRVEYSICIFLENGGPVQMTSGTGDGITTCQPARSGPALATPVPRALWRCSDPIRQDRGARSITGVVSNRTIPLGAPLCPNPTPTPPAPWCVHGGTALRHIVVRAWVSRAAAVDGI